MPILGIIASSASANQAAFESIATVTASGSSSTIEFTSIPSTYQHLQIRFRTRATSTIINGNLDIRFNGDTGSNYSYRAIAASNTNVTVNRGATQSTIRMNNCVPGTSSLASLTGVGVIDIFDYTSTTRYKTLRGFHGKNENNSSFTYNYVTLQAGTWNSGSVISSIQILSTNGDNFTTATEFALYGIKG